MKRFFLIFIVIFSVFVTEMFAEEWNGIVPCVSSRFDAEKLLGKDNFPINLSIYRYKKFRVHIIYERKNKNNPDKDIVKKITVYPDKSETLAKYRKKISSFQKDFRKTEIDVKVSHIYGQAVYRNWNEGFAIWVQKNENDVEVVSSFEYFPPNLPTKSSSSWCD